MMGAEHLRKRLGVIRHLSRHPWRCAHWSVQFGQRFPWFGPAAIVGNHCLHRSELAIRRMRTRFPATSDRPRWTAGCSGNSVPTALPQLPALQRLHEALATECACYPVICQPQRDAMCGCRFTADVSIAARAVQTATKSEASKVLPNMRRFQVGRRHGGETSTLRKTSRTDWRDCRGSQSNEIESAGICGQTEADQ